MKTFRFELADGKSKEMDIEEFSRWCCLIEAIEVIGNKSDKLGIPIESDLWIKPIPIQKYIAERLPAMKHDVTVEATLGNI